MYVLDQNPGLFNFGKILHSYKERRQVLSISGESYYNTNDVSEKILVEPNRLDSHWLCDLGKSH